jgi:hypothetical protein
MLFNSFFFFPIFLKCIPSFDFTFILHFIILGTFLLNRIFLYIFVNIKSTLQQIVVAPCMFNYSLKRRIWSYFFLRQQKMWWIFFNSHCINCRVRLNLYAGFHEFKKIFICTS